MLVFRKARCTRQIESLAHFNTVSCLAHYLRRRSPVTRITPLSFITSPCNTVYSSLISFPYEIHYSLPPFHAPPVQPGSLCFIRSFSGFLSVSFSTPCCCSPSMPLLSFAYLPYQLCPPSSPSTSPFSISLHPLCPFFFYFLWPRPFSLFLHPSLSISLCFLLRTRR